MPADYRNANINSLITDSKCIRPLCTDGKTKAALEVYARVRGLAAAGGRNYDGLLNTLLQDAKTYQVLIHNGKMIDTLEAWLAIQNAIANGSTISTDPNVLAAAYKCYSCLGQETIQQLNLFLKILTAIQGKP